MMAPSQHGTCSAGGSTPQSPASRDFQRPGRGWSSDGWTEISSCSVALDQTMGLLVLVSKPVGKTFKL